MTKIAGAVWVDATGKTRLTILKASANVCTVLAAVQSISNAQIQYNWDGTVDPPIGGPATPAKFQGVSQWAQLNFMTAGGVLVRVTLPAPQAAIFMADGQTIDPAAISSVITACVGNLSDLGGNPVTAYVGGTLEPSPSSDLTPIG